MAGMGIGTQVKLGGEQGDTVGSWTEGKDRMRWLAKLGIRILSAEEDGFTSFSPVGPPGNPQLDPKQLSLRLACLFWALSPLSYVALAAVMPRTTGWGPSPAVGGDSSSPLATRIFPPGSCRPSEPGPSPTPPHLATAAAIPRPQPARAAASHRPSRGWGFRLPTSTLLALLQGPPRTTPPLCLHILGVRRC